METMPQQRALRRLRLDLQRHGLYRTLYLLMIKVINKFALFRILRGMYLHHVNQAYLPCPAGYTCGFLSEPQLRRYAMDPRNELDGDFLDEALAKGDRCYAILKDGCLAAYSWYSLQPTRIHPPQLLLEFDTRYVYMYKGMTRAEHRGLRLYPIGINRALQWYQRCGKAGLVAYVESHNLDSLKSCLRLGYRIFGSIYVLHLLGRYLLLNTRGCRREGFRLKEIPSCPDALGANEA